MNIPDKPKFDVFASLHFMPSGDYLFVDYEQAGQRSKFLTVDAVRTAFTSLGQDTGWMPAGLVRHGHGEKGMWYVYSAPGQKVDIQLGGAQLTVPLPRTVLVHYDRVVRLFAMASSSFEPGEQAYKLPFPNVYDDGRVCWGQNTVPAAEPMRARDTWKLFFSGTAFNHDLSNGKSRTYERDVCQLLETLQGKGKFPASELVKMGKKTIGKVIEEIML